MRNLLIAIIFCLNFAYNFSANAQTITEDKYNYIVKYVKQEGLLTEQDGDIQQFAMQNVKRKALDELFLKLGYSNIVLDEQNINATISGFKIIDEYYNKDYYSIIADFSFSKIVIADVIKAQKDNELNAGKKKISNSRLVNVVVILKENDDLIDEYKTFHQWLKKNKIKHSPQQITNNQIHVKLFNVDEDNIYSSLRKLNLNGSMYIEL